MMDSEQTQPVVNFSDNIRTDVEEYFRRVVLAYGKLTDTPLVAFVFRANGIDVEVITKPGQTRFLPDETPMMGQWRGEWRSDYFRFTAGQLKAFVAENPDAVYFRKEWGM